MLVCCQSFGDWVRLKRPLREGWDKQFKLMADTGDDSLLDEDLAATIWDEDEWEW